MPVVSDPCSCQSDCCVCGREEEPPHDCAIHVLLESMVFQERMLHGEPTEAKLEEILKHGKEYLPLAMLMTDENSVRWQTMYNYVESGFPQHQGNSSRNTGGCWSPSRSFQSIQICQAIRQPRHSRQRCVAGPETVFHHDAKVKTGDPDVIFNILNAELSSLATSFAISLNAGSALVENPRNLFVESYKTSPVLHVQDSPVPNSILTERIPTPPVEPERIPTPPVEPERPPLVDPSVFMDNVEVTPPLITRCDKGTQTISLYLHVKRFDLGKKRMEQPQAHKRLSIKQEPSEVSNNIVLWMPRNHPFMKFSNNGFIIQPTNVNGINK
ncbi:uncharacterized protein TNCV_4985461 [Trichonephila clavipes]|nr:uncharacterized protein TNCV_4985461 [Trichonephila clavipes]